MSKPEVLAVVGGREITRNDINYLLSTLNPQTAAQFRSEDGMKNLVKELVNQELFYLDAVDKGFDNEEGFINELDKVKSNILKQYALNKALGQASINEDEIENYYNDNKDLFMAQPSVRASHILVSSLDEANSISDEIRNGLSFEDAAEKYSSCPSKERGGDLGYFSSGMMVPEFENASFKLEKDQISAPVQTQFGYHLIKVFDKKAGAVRSIEEVRDQIGNQLLGQKQQEIYQSKVNELKGKYDIKMNI